MSTHTTCSFLFITPWYGLTTRIDVILRRAFLTALWIFIANGSRSHVLYEVEAAARRDDAGLGEQVLRPELQLGTINTTNADNVNAEAVTPENTTYSVILVGRNKHCSNLFRDQDRVNTFTSGVINVNLASSIPKTTLEDTPGDSPFMQQHVAHADKRVRIVYTDAFGRVLNENQVRDHVQVLFCLDDG